jgi:DNA-directed RNA polymerase specialized sigma24 family protein
LTACCASESLTRNPFVESIETWGISLESPNFGPEWVIASPDDEAAKRSKSHERLLEASRSAWPHALSYARSTDTPDGEWLATEVWEELLRSVLRTMLRLGNLGHVTNLESYLIGAFRHRFKRALVRERQYRRRILLTESVEKLESLGRIQDWEPVERLEREVQVRQALKFMDSWTRRVWNYIKYGYSIKEIARSLDLTEFQVEFRYRRRLARLRDYFRRRGGTAA